MKKTTLFSLIFIFSGFGPMTAGSRNHSAVDITSQLVSDLTDFERSAPTEGPTAQVHACLELTFRKWADAYNAVLRTANLTYPDIKIKMDEYATTWYRMKHQLAVANFYFPNIETKLEHLFEEATRVSNGTLKPVSAVSFRIDDIDRKTYNLYLKFCLSQYFARRSVESILGENEGTVLPPSISSLYQGTAGWRYSAQSGWEPYLNPGTGITPPEQD
jgi:hypothetical protein